MTTRPIHAILIGAGNRGADSYAPYALQHPQELRFVAVAEPDPVRRARFASAHNIPIERQFSGWEELLDRPPLGEAALVCTQDWQHTAPALAAMRAGYHVLLEKPMAPTEKECRTLVKTSEETGQQLHICHVLRYTAHGKKLSEILHSGQLGEIVDIDHRENVSWWHMAHSFVRGAWRNADQSNPMILAKCCHDLDFLPWISGQTCVRLSSTGSLLEFKADHAPAGAPKRCTDGCPVQASCIYYAPWLYMELVPFWRSFVATGQGLPAALIRTYLKSPQLIRAASAVVPFLRQVTQYRGWPLGVLAEDPTPENILHALQTGPYGRCVYACDNNVVDHQVVMMEFSGGASVTLTMHGHSHIEYRSTKVEGTRGRLMAELGNGGAWITVDDHRSGKRQRFNTSGPTGEGHGGGDAELMAGFVASVRGQAAPLTPARESLASHLLAFAAETSRLKHSVVETSDFFPGKPA
ncbi:MAG TPA: Gfo/Idh/MocA family oxidoreductase [Longilinea sp.]|nr:Gfo/Idh/MocA family oxidoreductase [Longilinea sp.]